MKILARSKEGRGNELSTYQFECPTYLLPELLKFKKMEVTWNEKPSELEYKGKSTIGASILVTLTSTKEALFEFFGRVCPRYSYESSVGYVFLIKDTLQLWDKNYSDNTIINKNKTTDPHLQQIAEQMYDLYNESVAVELKEGGYHIPFYDDIIDSIGYRNRYKLSLVKISTASISNPQETDYSKLIEIHDKLVKGNELDTFVHCARVMSDDEYKTFIKGKARSYNLIANQINFDDIAHLGWCDNFKGFISYKNLIKNER